MGRIGLLQLDSVNVLVRSHYLPMFSRLGAYDMDRLDEHAYGSGEWFEYWGHEASVLPVDDYPMLRYRMTNRRPWRAVREILDDHPDYIDQVIREIEAAGPLAVGDLQDPGDRTGPWWGYGKGKLVLEWLFATGVVTCSHRRNFTRYYDLVERVLPDRVLRAEPLSQIDAHRRMLERAARFHGVGTDDDLADYYRIKVTQARPRLAELVADGVLIEVDVDGWDRTAYLHADAVVPRTMRASGFVSPFDPVVWYRPRAERLFGFHYRIEIYVPQPKRVFGYYVLPFLHDGELVGRADLKSDRRASRLLVRGAFIEPHRDERAVSAAMADHLSTMARWLDHDDVAVESNGDLAASLRAHF